MAAPRGDNRDGHNCVKLMNNSNSSDTGLQNTGQSYSTAILSETTQNFLWGIHFKDPSGLYEELQGKKLKEGRARALEKRVVNSPRAQRQETLPAPPGRKAATSCPGGVLCSVFNQAHVKAPGLGSKRKTLHHRDCKVPTGSVSGSERVSHPSCKSSSIKCKVTKWNISSKSSPCHP